MRRWTRRQRSLLVLRIGPGQWVIFWTPPLRWPRLLRLRRHRIGVVSSALSKAGKETKRQFPAIKSALKWEADRFQSMFKWSDAA
jgi:hypothetical protein